MSLSMIPLHCSVIKLKGHHSPIILRRLKNILASHYTGDPATITRIKQSIKNALEMGSLSQKTIQIR